MGAEMIKLTRLNNHPLVVNCDLIKSMENAPDTVLTLVTGDKIIMGESTEQVLQRVIEFRRAVLAGLTPPLSLRLLPARRGSNQSGAVSKA